MIRRLPLCIALALATTAHAQAPAEGADAMIPLTYVGANARVSLGINDDGDVLGEILGVLGKTDESAWLAELWLGQGGAGGVQFGYNWLRGEPESGSAAVWKVFVAGDQNAFEDRKVTLGLGRERDDLFWSAYYSHAASGKRLAGTDLDVVVNTLTGSDAGGNWTQTQTIETLIETFEHPYENGVGVRFGGYFDDSLLRVRGGLDYEKGRFDSDQATLSLGIDKYFRDSRFSLSVMGEALRKSGDFVADKSDTRGWLMLRYDLGQNFRAREPFRMVEVSVPAAEAAAPAGEAQVVRNEVRMDGDAFFGFDQSTLRPDAVAALDELVARLESVARVSRVSVVGHTDSVGPVDYNQRLSERRAEAAKAYLVERGIPAEQIDTRGEGELKPSFPNDTAENRQRNRRVDIEFLTIEETVVPAPAPEPAPARIEWVREPVKANPAWIERALRNPAEHKRTVDVYAFERTTQTETLGPRVYQNRPPVAVNDSVMVDTNSPGTLIAVLANDSDPDGDTLVVSAVSSPAHGSATIGAGGIVYVPTAGYSGSDSFTYTISDGRGGSATATVSITVGTPNRPPVAVDDAASVAKGYDMYLDVLGNDSDPDGDELTITEVVHTGPGLAEISIETGNMVRYQSLPGFVGNDTFTYTISDGRGGTSSATVTVRVIELPPYH